MKIRKIFGGDFLGWRVHSRPESSSENDKTSEHQKDANIWTKKPKRRKTKDE
jgi:hypothetical protein